MLQSIALAANFRLRCKIERTSRKKFVSTLSGGSVCGRAHGRQEPELLDWRCRCGSCILPSAGVCRACLVTSDADGKQRASSSTPDANTTPYNLTRVQHLG